MGKIEWVPVLYNGLETNIEVTRCGRIKRVEKDWYGNHASKYGEIEFLRSNAKNYKVICIQIFGIKKKIVLLHQLIAAAFLDYKFQGHKNVVDHIDSNTLNNKVDNLKVTSNRENNSKERTLKSGLPVGVCFNKRDKKYQSAIRDGKKRYYLGNFNTIEEASNAYQTKLLELTNPA